MIRIILNNIIIISLIWSYTLFPVTKALAQDSCAENLIQAEKYYYEGEFDKSISLIRTCLQAGNLTQSELVKAYKIWAQTYLAKNNPDAARQIVKKILEIKPDYAPTIAEDPPPYVELVNRLKQEQAIQKSDAQAADTKWLWIGAGGVAIIGIITLIALSGSEEEPKTPEALATPPPWPTDN